MLGEYTFVVRMKDSVRHLRYKKDREYCIRNVMIILFSIVETGLNKSIYNRSCSSLKFWQTFSDWKEFVIYILGLLEGLQTYFALVSILRDSMLAKATVTNGSTIFASPCLAILPYLIYLAANWCNSAVTTARQICSATDNFNIYYVDLYEYIIEWLCMHVYIYDYEDLIFS